MYRMCSRNDPFPNLGLGHADIVRASHLQHAIEGVDSHVNLCHDVCIYVSGVRRRSLVSIARSPAPHSFSPVR